MYCTSSWSSIPNLSRTCCLMKLANIITSWAVAPPVFTIKLACFSLTIAPPIFLPRKPALSISQPAGTSPLSHLIPLSCSNSSIIFLSALARFLKKDPALFAPCGCFSFLNSMILLTLFAIFSLSPADNSTVADKIIRFLFCLKI